MTCIETMSFIKDFVMTVAASVGSVVAILGLNTWRKQLTGQAGYDLSRRILISLLEYRNAIMGVRNPAMWNMSVLEVDERELEGKDADERMRIYQYRGQSKEYEKRWQVVSEKRKNLDADLLEAEAIWGEELMGYFIPIFRLEAELMICVRHHLMLLDPSKSEGVKRAIQKKSETERDILYGDWSGVDDEYTNDLNRAIRNIESYLKPKLHR